MNPNGAAQQGYTAVITSANMTAPLLLSSQLAGGPIRAVNVTNQTGFTTASIIAGQSPQGPVLFAVVPGAMLTLPIASQAWLCIVFSFAAGKYFSGSIYVHVDPRVLPASGSYTPGVFFFFFFPAPPKAIRQRLQCRGP